MRGQPLPDSGVATDSLVRAVKKDFADDVPDCQSLGLNGENQRETKEKIGENKPKGMPQLAGTLCDRDLLPWDSSLNAKAIHGMALSPRASDPPKKLAPGRDAARLIM